ncbi:MAG TPA: class I SAM-dependent methyltransferase [Deltaproteobacteria bacterium]|nr:class I SAM-dependent methyltransferase [Deltaproteobacteria bacterium]
MRLSRSVSLWIHFFLDQCLPPLIRDNRWFMAIPFRLLFGDKASIFASFKDEAPFMSPEAFRRTYAQLADVHLDRPTDLNAACTEAIEGALVGRTVLDAGCGRGWLAARLAPRAMVTGLDQHIDPALPEAHPGVTWVEGSVSALPFDDDAFDTVVCTHTLEHVQDLAATVRELRRVARQRLIVVVPRQRPYQHTFDLHLHFFPVRGSLLIAMGGHGGLQECTDRGGDWFYVEDQCS